MDQDWIKKIVDDKKQKKDSEEREKKASLAQSTKLNASVDAFCTEIGTLLKYGIERYNHLVPDDKIIRWEIPPHHVFHARTMKPPEGDLTVNIDKEHQRLMCSYQFSDHGRVRQSVKAYTLTVADDRITMTDEHLKVIPQAEIVEEILKPFLINI